jgi:hypothetical protein
LHLRRITDQARTREKYFAEKIPTNCVDFHARP